MFDPSLRLVPTGEEGVWRIDDGSLALRIVDARGPVWTVHDETAWLEIEGSPRSGFRLWSWGDVPTVPELD